MKREEIPKYRLQILLDMRQKAKIDAEQSLLDAKAKLAEEQLQMDKLLKCKQDLLRLCLIKKEQDFKKVSDIEYVSSDAKKADDSFDEIDNDLLILEEQILLQGQNVLLREHAVQEAKKLFANKNTDFAALQKHKEKWLKEFEIGNDFDEGMNGVREEPAFIREMAAQGANWIDRLRASTEFLGLNITLDNLRHSKLESSSWKEKLKAQMRQEEEGFREVQPQLAQILEEAKHEIQELQVKAVEEGRRAGYEQGILESMQLLAEARALRLKLIHEVESQSIKLVIKIAKKNCWL